MENLLTMSGVFIAGLVLGVFVGVVIRSTTGKVRRLEQQLDELQRKNTEYQAEVSSHFSQTAAIINRLNEDFQEVQAHLSKAAGQLCSTTEAESFKPLPEIAKNDEIVEEVDEIDSAPLDYAPKTKDVELGMLQEGFGLKR